MTQFYEYIKNHATVHFKRVNFLVHEFYLNRALKKNK